MKYTNIQLEVIRRLSKQWRADTPEDTESAISWAGNVTQVSTDTAFKLAKGGGSVFMIYEDGTDSILDDIEFEEEYYKDKSKTYPEIDTIFVVEGVL